MAEKTGKILAVDDNTDILFALKLLLKQHFAEIVTDALARELCTDDVHHDSLLLMLHVVFDVMEIFWVPPSAVKLSDSGETDNSFFVSVDLSSDSSDLLHAVETAVIIKIRRT